MPEWFKKIWGKNSNSVNKGLLDESLKKTNTNDEDGKVQASKLGNQAMSEFQDEKILKELEAGTENSSLTDKENPQSEEDEQTGEKILEKLNDVRKGKTGVSDYDGLPGQLAEIPRVEAPDNIFSKGGLKVKDFFKNRFQSIKKHFVKNHQKAVDDYNHYSEDYKNQGAWDRFTWALSNPIAWMRAGKASSELDTLERDVERAKLNRIAENVSTVMGKSEDTDMSLEALLGEKEGSVLGKGPDSFDIKDTSEEKKEFGPEFSGAGEKVKGAADAASFLRNATYPVGGIAGKAGANIKVQAGLGPIARAPLSLAEAAGNTAKAIEAGKRGDKYSSINEGLNAAENVSFAANYALLGATRILAAKGTQAAGATAGNLTYKALPAVGLLTGAIQTGRGITNLVGYNKQKKNIGNLIAKINGLSKDKKTNPKKYAKQLKILNQINNFSEVNKTKGGFDIASGALYTLGNIGKMSVVGMPLGMGLETLGLIMSSVRDLVADYQHQETKKKTVDEEMGIEKKISAVRRWMPGLDREKAKYVVFKSMGIDSGSKTEAFQRMTMKRAIQLKKMADKGGTLSEKIVQGMNLKKTKDQGYSLQAIAMKMGMGDTPWQEQLKETIKKKKNPFLKK